ESGEDFAILDRRPGYIPPRIMVADTVFPRGHTLWKTGVAGDQVVFDSGDLRQNLCALIRDLFIWDFNRRLVVVVQKRVEAVILRLRNRIEFVIMALGATDRQAEEGFADRVNAIDYAFDAELFGIDAALLIEHGVAKEARRHAVLQRRMRQQIARQLFNRELIERQILVERVDHPVAIRPDRA